MIKHRARPGRERRSNPHAAVCGARRPSPGSLPAVVLALLGSAAVLAVAIALAGPGPAAGSQLAGVACPLKPSPGIPAGDSWAFTQTGGLHPATVSTYTHGRGSWAGGRGTGTICKQDTLAGGRPRDLVLAVRGQARLSPGTSRLGKRGVRLQLSVSVQSSNDPACPIGTPGTIGLFASYYSVHQDAISVSFSGGCTDFGYGYAGTALRVAIARNGRQVN